MGIYTEYLNKNMTPLVMEAERKRLLTLISSLRAIEMCWFMRVMPASRKRRLE